MSECGCEVYEICSSCNPEQYYYEVEKRGLDGVKNLMGEQHKVSVGPVKVHLLRPDHHRLTYCRMDSFDHDELVTRNYDRATGKHCKRRHTPWYFRLTYVPRVLIGLPLYVIGRVGMRAWDGYQWIVRHTWAP